MSTSDFVKFNQKAFIKKVWAYMKANKLSVRKFADLAGVPRGSISRILYENVELKQSTLAKLQKAISRVK